MLNSAVLLFCTSEFHSVLLFQSLEIRLKWRGLHGKWKHMELHIESQMRPLRGQSLGQPFSPGLLKGYGLIIRQIKI